MISGWCQSAAHIGQVPRCVNSLVLPDSRRSTRFASALQRSLLCDVAPAGAVLGSVMLRDEVSLGSAVSVWLA